MSYLTSNQILQDSHMLQQQEMTCGSIEKRRVAWTHQQNTCHTECEDLSLSLDLISSPHTHAQRFMSWLILHPAKWAVSIIHQSALEELGPRPFREPQNHRYSSPLHDLVQHCTCMLLCTLNHLQIPIIPQNM